MATYKQLHRHKWLEVGCNTASGMLLAVMCTQLGDHFGFWEITIKANVLLTITLTIISVLRSMVWRMIFDHWNNKRLSDKLGVN